MTPKNPAKGAIFAARPELTLTSSEHPYYGPPSTDVNTVVVHENSASTARLKAIEPTIAEIWDAWLAAYGHLCLDDFDDDGYPIAESR